MELPGLVVGAQVENIATEPTIVWTFVTKVESKCLTEKSRKSKKGRDEESPPISKNVLVTL